MVTTTAPARANAVPSYQRSRPEPVTNAPPWIQTRTGLRPASAAGAKTFRVRQSSLISHSLGRGTSESRGGGWGATARKRPASSVPDHGSAGSGGSQRLGPTGGVANGRPRNCSTPDRTMPATRPQRVSTTVVALPLVIAQTVLPPRAGAQVVHDG